MGTAGVSWIALFEFVTSRAERADDHVGSLRTLERPATPKQPQCLVIYIRGEGLAEHGMVATGFSQRFGEREGSSFLKPIGLSCQTVLTCPGTAVAI